MADQAVARGAVSTDCPMAVSNGGAAPERIRALERALQASLPEDYRAFLRVHNGGEPQRACFAFTDREGRAADSVISRFYGVDDPGDDLEKTWRYFLEGERVPPGYLPIARDVFGNMLLLSLAPASFGSVHFWDHELEHLEGEAMVSFVAGSFEALVVSLVKDPDEQP